MSFLNLIATRRSSGFMDLEKPVGRDLIEQVIQAGAWAPSHKRTEPWRFVIFEGKGRENLDKAMVKDGGEILKNKAMRAPVIIAVWAAVGRGKIDVSKLPVWEEEAATAACIQNMLLAAENLNLSAIWRTGNVVNMPSVQALMSTKEDTFSSEKKDRIMGFVYLGYPDKNKPKPNRETPFLEDKIRWIS